MHALDPATGADHWTFDGGGGYGSDLSTSAAVLADGSVLWPGHPTSGHVHDVAAAGYTLFDLALGSTVASYPAFGSDGLLCSATPTAACWASGAPMYDVQLLVLAKAPVAGRVKTRLCPPLTAQQAADVAEAALLDTLDAVRRTEVRRRVLVLDGSFAAAGFEVLPQRGDGLDERLAAAFDDGWSAAQLPMLLIGMDTPEVTPEGLATAVEALVRTGCVLGLAEDGGWWALGLDRPDASLLLGIPTSQDDTGALQRDRLLASGRKVFDLPVLRDVDAIGDLLAVAELAPDGRFAATVRTILAGLS